MPAHRPSNQPPMMQSVPDLGPRSIPWQVYVRLLFGGFANQFGWVWLLFSLIFVWAFLRDLDFAKLTFPDGPRSTTQGVVTAVDDTSVSEDDWPIYKVTYRFTPPGTEETLYNESYTTDEFLVGQEVQIEYPADDPAISRIVGTRQTLVGISIFVLIMIFPLIGLGFILFGLIRGLLALRLLTVGELALARLMDKAPTAMTVNDRRVYAMTFTFTTNTGVEQRVVARTHTPELLEDHQYERVVYNPDNPSEARLVDAISSRLELDDLGRFIPGRTASTALLLVLPALTLLGIGLIALQ